MYAEKTSKSANPFSHFPTGNRIYGLEIHGVTVKLFAEVALTWVAKHTVAYTQFFIIYEKEYFRKMGQSG